MSNYTENPNSCRVDFFRPNGKWYATEAVIFRGEDYAKGSVHLALRHALHDSVVSRYQEMTTVCLEPYHQHSHPVSLVWDGYSPPLST